MSDPKRPSSSPGTDAARPATSTGKTGPFAPVSGKTGNFTPLSTGGMAVKSSEPQRPSTTPGAPTGKTGPFAPVTGKTGNFAPLPPSGKTGPFAPVTGKTGSFSALDPVVAPKRPDSAASLDPAVPSASDRSAQKSQALGKNVVAAMSMLVRSVKLYDPENAIFQKPLQALLDSINTLVARDGKLELAVVEGNFYVNGQLVRAEANSLESLRYLAQEMEGRGVGGFNLQRPTTVQELKNFVSIFSKDQAAAAGEEGLEDKKLVSMRLTKWNRIKEKLNSDADGKVDRKKYAMTVYARTVFYVENTVADYRAGKPFPVDSALRLVQEIVDLTRTFRSQFLGMTCNGDGEKALVHHLANTALLAVAFGSELGLNRAQLRELGYAALFADLPLCAMPVEYRFQIEPERLPPEINKALIACRRGGIRSILSHGAASRAHRLLAAVCSEVSIPFGKPTRDGRGRITFVLPQGDPLQYSRIIAIASYYDLLTSTVPDREAYGPEIALDVMWNQQRFRFDPELLAIFMKVMASQPIKVLERGQQTVALG